MPGAAGAEGAEGPTGPTGPAGFSAITVSSATPSGGTDGDFWVVYS
jgi:hypothetical protein